MAIYIIFNECYNSKDFCLQESLAQQIQRHLTNRYILLDPVNVLLLINTLTDEKEKLQIYWVTTNAKSGINSMWILKNSKHR